jgi:hypothetical protein
MPPTRKAMRIKLDHDQWVRRAVAFAKGCRKLPGEKRIEAEADPPLTQEQISKLASSS